VALRSALLVSESVTPGIEPHRPLSDSECRAERLGFALRDLAAEFVDERRKVAGLRRKVAELTARLEACHAERRRIERDLHDSAQQRLVALRVHLTLAGERLDRSEERTMLERLGVEVDDAIDELRTVAHGIYPPILADQGIGAALASVARSSAMPVEIRDGWLGRHSEAVETTVYFCCLEGLQNAAKHAGPGASATIHLSEAGGCVSFSVEDDGAGFDPDDVDRGAVLTNLTDRVAAVGGTLQIDAGPGRGTRITGEIPVHPDWATRRRSSCSSIERW
jgi:signal transduction histidine kinase